MFMTLRKAKLLFLGAAAAQLSVFLSMCCNEAPAADTSPNSAYKNKKVETRASDVQKNAEKTGKKEPAAAPKQDVKVDSKPSSVVSSKAPTKTPVSNDKNSKLVKKAGGKGNNKKSDDKTAKSEGQAGDKKGKSDKKPKVKETVLVPPPPPTTPSFLPGQMSDLADIGPLDYLSKEDLKFKLDNLKKKLAAARQDHKDQEDLSREIKGKAERFDSLYIEGVVSKRELETSKRDAERSERDLERSSIKVDELQRMTETVQERLAKVEAASKPKAGKSIGGKATPVRKKKPALGKKTAN